MFPTGKRHQKEGAPLPLAGKRSTINISVDLDAIIGGRPEFLPTGHNLELIDLFSNGRVVTGWLRRNMMNALRDDLWPLSTGAIWGIDDLAAASG